MDYIKKTDKLGAIFTFLGIGLILAVPFAISLYYNAWPEMSSLLKGLASTLIIYFPVQIIEIFTYVPILGRGGSYLAFITGNISNLKAPAVMDSLKNAEVDPSSEEGEIVSTLAVATSALVTNVILLVGVVFFVISGLADVIASSTLLAPAFDNILAALFGAMAIAFISKRWKIAIAPIVVMLSLFFILGSSTYQGIASVLVPVAALITIGVARILYKKNLL
ncbi:MAG: hypothetical protein IKA97_04435 [Clostridia bacterium]|nr:hypothetical protein [Clostridia bacterium]